MRRREFLGALGDSLLAVPLLGDVSVVSQKPLIAEYNLESLEGRYTPTEEFYVRNHFAVPPALLLEQLRIDGEVEAPRSLSLSF